MKDVTSFLWLCSFLSCCSLKVALFTAQTLPELCLALPHGFSATHGVVKADSNYESVVMTAVFMDDTVHFVMNECLSQCGRYFARGDAHSLMGKSLDSFFVLVPRRC